MLHAYNAEQVLHDSAVGGLMLNGIFGDWEPRARIGPVDALWGGTEGRSEPETYR